MFSTFNRPESNNQADPTKNKTTQPGPKKKSRQLRTTPNRKSTKPRKTNSPKTSTEGTIFGTVPWARSVSKRSAPVSTITYDEIFNSQSLIACLYQLDIIDPKLSPDERCRWIADDFHR